MDIEPQPDLNQAPHTGKMLRKYIDEHRIYQSALSRKIKRQPQSLADFLKRSSIQTSILFELSLALHYNFFRQIAEQLPAGMPPVPENPLQARVTELEKQNSDLQLQIKTLERALQLIGK